MVQIKYEERDITDDEIENASLLIKELLQNNDPLINAMIDWHKGWYDSRGEHAKLEWINKEDIETELRGSSIKRKQFYRAFRDNYQDESLKEGFFKSLKEFMAR